MIDYTELVKALLSASTVSTAFEKLMLDAASAIEELQQIAYHYEQTANDYWKEACEYKAQLPKRGKWVREMNVYDEPFYHCSACGECFDSNRDDTYGIFNYCPNCGAKMKEVQDG